MFDVTPMHQEYDPKILAHLDGYSPKYGLTHPHVIMGYDHGTHLPRSPPLVLNEDHMLALPRK